jgi:hypothetical protein
MGARVHLGRTATAMISMLESIASGDSGMKRSLEFYRVVMLDQVLGHPFLVENSWACSNPSSSTSARPHSRPTTRSR